MAVEEANADKALTRNEVGKETASFELDLIAFFKVLQEEVVDAMETSVEEGASGDEIISAIDRVLG